MTDSTMLAALGLAAYGACPWCGTDVISPRGEAAADAQRAHERECLVRMGIDLEALLDEPAARADVAEYARLKAAGVDDTAARRWELRDVILDHLAAGGYGADAWAAWFELAAEPWENEAEFDDSGMAALRVAGLL
jgi:hypothetical protein